MRFSPGGKTADALRRRLSAPKSRWKRSVGFDVVIEADASPRSETEIENDSGVSFFSGEVLRRRVFR
jgi:hypothetical protein